MSSTLQNEKTKHDAKALGGDLKQHAHDAFQSVKDGVHKLGVATGLSKPTTGEKVGEKVESAVDTLTGEKNNVRSTDSSSTSGTCTNANCSNAECGTHRI